jgi:opacity protein-like surface antigen
MKRITFLAAAALCMASATTAHAEGLYVSGFGGLSILPNEEYNFGSDLMYRFDYSAGYSFGGAVGTHITENLRAEFELSRIVVGADKFKIPALDISFDLNGNLQGTLGLANLWFDWPNDSAISPYIGVGIGAGQMTMDTDVQGTPILTRSDIGLAAQVGAGVRFLTSDNLGVDLGYRFKTMHDLAFFSPDDGGANTMDFNVNTHQFQLGLTYEFN